MCDTLNDTVYFKPADLPFLVQRSWSNAAATAGHEPCVPAPDGAYFAAVPVLSGTLHGGYEGQSISGEGVHVAKGASTTLDVDLFSDAPTDPFTVAANAFGGAGLAFSWDTTSGQNGDVLHLTITRNTDAAGFSGMDLFYLVASQSGRKSVWVGAVGN
jgi:hypothetical protein